jgi:hypothetical protein
MWLKYARGMKVRPRLHQHKDTNGVQVKTMTVNVEEFIRRFLQHVLPKGLHNNVIEKDPIFPLFCNLLISSVDLEKIVTGTFYGISLSSLVAKNL